MKSWVVAWVTPTGNPPVSIHDDNACWLMVRHIDRGWELPGGWVESDETSDIAALREVYEETGLLGTAINTAENLAEGGGDVVWIVIDEEPTPISWESKDPKIAEVGWCLTPPEPLAWELNELIEFSTHDWSRS